MHPAVLAPSPLVGVYCSKPASTEVTRFGAADCTGDSNTAPWDGVVELEYERFWRPYPMNPEYGQQAIFGHWVHGFQTELEPEVWTTWFFERKRAALAKNEAAQP